MTSYTNSERHFEYAYNSDGMRTLKKVYENGELVYTEIYVWDGDVLLANKIIFTDGKDPVTARYLYDESGELYGMDYNGMGIFAYLKNLQGDIVSIVSLGEDGSTEVQMEYDAWGRPIFKQGSNALGLVLIALVNSVSYRGYFYDYDTGLYYLRSRYYDPEIGRFVNADDTDYLGYDCTSLGMNLFSYCENNPVNNIDTMGAYHYGVIGSNINNSISEMKRKFESMRRITLFSSYKPNNNIVQSCKTYYIYKGYNQSVSGKRTIIYLNYHPVSAGILRKRATVWIMSKEAWLLWYTKQNTNIITKFDSSIRRALKMSQYTWDMTLNALQEQTIYNKVAITASLYSAIVSLASEVSKRKPKYKFVYDICAKYKNKNQKIYILWSLETLDYRIVSSRGAKRYYGWVVTGSQNLF